MRHSYYNRSAVLESVGYLSLAVSLMGLYLRGDLRKLISTRQPILFFLCIALLLLFSWRAFAERHTWRRRVKLRSFCMLFAPAILLAFPVSTLQVQGNRIYDAQSLVALSPDSPQKVLQNGSKGDTSASIRSITDEEADRILEQQRNGSAPQALSESSISAEEAYGKTPQDEAGLTPASTPDAQSLTLDHQQRQQAAREAALSAPQPTIVNSIQELSLQKGQHAIELPNGRYALVHGYNAQEKRIDISDIDFYPWLSEFFTHPAQYAGYQVHLTGWIARDPAMKGETLLARYLITCCVADALPAGIFLQGEDLDALENGKWMELEGTLEIHETRGKSAPILHVDSIKPMETPEQPYIYYYDFQ